METLKFSYNWNNKLECNCFSTIRIFNPMKYRIGEKFNIELKGENKGVAELVAMQKVQFQWFTEIHALLDTGYNLEKLKDILSKMYAAYIEKNGKKALFGIYIFKKITE